MSCDSPDAETGVVGFVVVVVVVVVAVVVVVVTSSGCEQKLDHLLFQC